MKTQKWIIRILSLGLGFSLAANIYLTRLSIQQNRVIQLLTARMECARNLQGLGAAMTVYANDYDGHYSLQGSFSRDPNVLRLDPRSGITAGASLYRVIREADVSPESFICPDDPNAKADLNHEIIDLWNFGHDPNRQDL